MRTGSARASTFTAPPSSSGACGKNTSHSATSTASAASPRASTAIRIDSVMSTARSGSAARAPRVDLEPARAHVLRLGPDQLVQGVLLEHVGAPAGDPPAGEHRDEAAGLEAQRLEHQRGVELDVGAQVATRLDLLQHPQRGLLGGAREVEQPAI